MLRYENGDWKALVDALSLARTLRSKTVIEGTGGPQQSTTILVYKVYADGFVGQDLGSSAAQSVVLLVVVGLLTVAQFKFIERKVHY